MILLPYIFGGCYLAACDVTDTAGIIGIVLHADGQSREDAEVDLESAETFPLDGGNVLGDGNIRNVRRQLEYDHLTIGQLGSLVDE